MDLTEFLGLVGSTPFGLYLEGWSCIQVGMMFQFGYYQQEKISQPNWFPSQIIWIPEFLLQCHCLCGKQVGQNVTCGKEWG